MIDARLAELEGHAPFVPEARVLGRASAATKQRVRATRILAASPLGSSARTIDPHLRVGLVDLVAADRSAVLVDLTAGNVIDQFDLSRWLRNPEPRPAAADETAIEFPAACSSRRAIAVHGPTRSP